MLFATRSRHQPSPIAHRPTHIGHRPSAIVHDPVMIKPSCHTSYLYRAYFVPGPYHLLARPLLLQVSIDAGSGPLRVPRRLRATEGPGALLPYAVCSTGAWREQLKPGRGKRDRTKNPPEAKVGRKEVSRAPTGLACPNILKRYRHPHDEFPGTICLTDPCITTPQEPRA